MRDSNERSLKALYERLELIENGVIDAVAHARTIDFTLDQSSILEDPQVFGDRRLSERHFIDDVATHTGRSSGQDAQYLNTCRMRDCLCETSEPLIELNLRRWKRLRF